MGEMSEIEWTDATGEFPEPYRVGKKSAGRMLDGQVWSQFPITSLEV